MDVSFLLLFLTFLSSPSVSSSTIQTLSQGSSLSVERPEDVLVSPNSLFSAGFYLVGDNSYCLAIWFTKSINRTVVWMANRDQPVNGRRSELSLLRNGNLILTDAGWLTVWSTSTVGASMVQLKLNDDGNLELIGSEGVVYWHSFDSPTDTLLPHQPLTRNTRLVSRRSHTNISSGFYQLFFDNDNLLRLRYDGPDVSSFYWPDPWRLDWETGRSPFNNSRIALLDPSGSFISTDDFTFQSSDLGASVQRRLTLDFDGNVRLYSFEEGKDDWVVTWQAISQPCKIHGICGPNSLCSYLHDSGRRCSCLPGYEMKNSNDWTDGCIPKFNLSCQGDKAGFVHLPHVEFYGYDIGFFRNQTLDSCKMLCSQKRNCKGFQYRIGESDGVYHCYPKTLLLNGYTSPPFIGHIYLKFPKADLLPHGKSAKEFLLDCSGEIPQPLARTYPRSRENGVLTFMLWFACAVGGVEMICILLVWCFLRKIHQEPSADTQGYGLPVTQFIKFTYAELKKATQGFSEEIGRGGGGTVYKGLLSDHREAAIKQLNLTNQGEAEFWAEVSTIGRLNHMNLIELWGYCAEGKHRLLVYEYMDHGSLAQNLTSNTLDWKKRFEIAVGTAKGLAYLHEECLEWVLHCDVKPQNILLDSNYQPKVSDFGLSKLLNRGGFNNSSFSRIRGTRGYMAPEWVLNLPITSKVDVYSYGIVVLEMVTGKSAAMDINTAEGRGEHKSLVAWVKRKMNGETRTASWMEEILDPKMEGKYDTGKMEILVAVALQCLQEDKDQRPTMGQVVEMLLRHENDYY
ncbi:hypothetical protein PVL29_011971 [Vitis rotundifolia]|uniref:Receptor-like serine/threonine-protein kinase n=1 Tax=Vitis rotundifolia TaxID=103349 RepID=A0AA38ZRI1_VITRO|nr:hypothetical protein PVL29_011971 [Vitis rotundifolia]